MEVEALAGLKAAFEEWRSKKRHPREAVPADLLERACAAARRHGPAAVARATKVDRGRLKTGRRSRVGREPAASLPAFSRMEIGAPAGTTRPFAEVEMPTGLKVRLFGQTDEALGLLSSLLGAGGAR
jgi:hypothetical protein